MREMAGKVREALEESLRHWEKNVFNFENNHPIKKEQNGWFTDNCQASFCPLCRLRCECGNISIQDGCLVISTKIIKIVCPLFDSGYVCCKEWGIAEHKAYKGRLKLEHIVAVRDRIKTELEKWDAM